MEAQQLQKAKASIMETNNNNKVEGNDVPNLSSYRTIVVKISLT